MNDKYKEIFKLCDHVFKSVLNEGYLITNFNKYQAYVGAENANYFIEIVDKKFEEDTTTYFWVLHLHHNYDDNPHLEKINEGKFTIGGIK